MSSATSWDRTGFFVIIVDDYPFAANAFQSLLSAAHPRSGTMVLRRRLRNFYRWSNLFWVHLYFWVSVDNIPG